MTDNETEEPGRFRFRIANFLMSMFVVAPGVGAGAAFSPWIGLIVFGATSGIVAWILGSE